MFVNRRSSQTHCNRVAPAFAALILSICVTGIPAQAHPLSQGRVEMLIDAHKITLKLVVTVEEIIVQQSLSSGNDDKFPISSENYQKHGTYLLRHFYLNADGKRLDGRIVKIEEPSERSFHPLDMGRAWATYEIEYAVGALPDALVLSQNVLNEIDFEPGNRWEVSYISSVHQAGQSKQENLYLSSSTPLNFPCARNTPSMTPAPENTQSPPASANLLSNATKPTVDASSKTHLVAFIALCLSALYLLATLRKRRAN